MSWLASWWKRPRLIDEDAAESSAPAATPNDCDDRENESAVRLHPRQLHTHRPENVDAQVDVTYVPCAYLDCFADVGVQVFAEAEAEIKEPSPKVITEGGGKQA